MTILYHGFELRNRIVGFGDVFIYSLVCYLKSKELKYDVPDIVFPRFYHFGYDINPELTICQDSDGLPWRYLPNNSKPDYESYEKVINTIRPNSLFRGYKGIMAPFFYTALYLDIYWHKYKKPPYLILERKSKLKNYILFHYRNYPQWGHRNSNVSLFEFLFRSLKDNLGDKYEFYKIGEPTHIDHQFDKIIKPSFRETEIINLVNNSALLICGQSGVRDVGWSMEGLPIICLPGKSMNSFSTWWYVISRNSGYNLRHAEWAKDRYLEINNSNEESKIKIEEFIKRFKL